MRHGGEERAGLGHLGWRGTGREHKSDGNGALRLRKRAGGGRQSRMNFMLRTVRTDIAHEIQRLNLARNGVVKLRNKCIVGHVIEQLDPERV